MADVDAKAFLAQLNLAREAGQAKVEVDFDRLTHPSCPLPFEAFKGQIVYVYLGIALAIGAIARWGFQADVKTILIVLASVTVPYWIVGRRFLEAVAKRKILSRLTSDGDAWEKIWRFGGVTVTINTSDAQSVWTAPKDRWKDAYVLLGGRVDGASSSTSAPTAG